MINILYNALIATEKSFGYSTVIASYLDDLCEYLVEYPRDIHVYLVIQRRALGRIDPKNKLRNSPYFHIIELPNLRNTLFRSLVEQVFLNYAAIRYKCGIIHMPATLGLIFSLKKQLLFFHASTTFMLERKLHGRSKLATLLHNVVIWLSARRADLLATTTHVTAQELLGYLKVDRSYSVIGNGFQSFISDDQPNPDVVAKLARKQFVLFVSSFYELKNQRLLVDLFQGTAMEHLHLVLVGNPVQRDYYEECMQNLDSERTTILAADTATLAWLYKNCVLYVSPSLFEGFSLTPLEALSLDAPILLSDIAVHREVYGDGFNYFDPKDISDLASKISNSLTPTYRQSCAKWGESLLQTYTWRRFTQRNIDLYHELVCNQSVKK